MGKEVVAENTQQQSKLHDDSSVDNEISRENRKSFRIKYFLSNRVLSLVNFFNLAELIASENGSPDEMMPLLFALVKSRNGIQDETQNYLNEGKYIQ